MSKFETTFRWTDDVETTYELTLPAWKLLIVLDVMRHVGEDQLMGLRRLLTLCEWTKIQNKGGDK